MAFCSCRRRSVGPGRSSAKGFKGMDEVLQAIGEKVVAALPGAVTDLKKLFGELTLIVDPARIIDVLKFLRDDPGAQFVSMIDVSGADYPEREKRFDIVYHLLSPKMNRRIRIKLLTDEDTPVASATEAARRSAGRAIRTVAIATRPAKSPARESVRISAAPQTAAATSAGQDGASRAKTRMKGRTTPRYPASWFGPSSGPAIRG